MSKIDKTLKRWENKPTSIEKEEAFNILEKFEFKIENKKGSHVKVSHEKLKNQLDFGLNGEFILPVKNGRKIKGFYIKTILKALKTINEVD